MASYPKVFRKYTSTNPISVKIGTIVHFDGKGSQKKFWTMSTFLTSLWRHRFWGWRHIRRFCLQKSDRWKSIFWKYFVFTRLWYIMRWVYYLTFQGHVTPYRQCFFSVFFQQKFEKEISIIYLKGFWYKFSTGNLKKNHPTKSGGVDPTIPE